MTFYDLNMNSKRINDTQDPSANQDVATKLYVDTANTTPIYYPNLKRAGRSGGVLATTLDATFAVTSTSGGVTTSFVGYPVFYALYLKAGTIVNGVVVYSGTSASGILGRVAGLYSKDGTQLSASSDTSSSITNSQAINIPFNPYEVLTDDWYYAAFNQYTNSSGAVTFVTARQGSTFATGTTLDSRATLYNYPQTTTNATGNLSLFRAATTTTTFGSAGARLPFPNISSFGLTLKPLGLQLWMGVF